MEVKLLSPRISMGSRNFPFLFLVMQVTLFNLESEKDMLVKQKRLVSDSGKSTCNVLDIIQIESYPI